MISVLAVAPDKADATSFYRCVGPFSGIRKSNPEIQIIYPDKMDWTYAKNADVVFLQRPFNDEHVRVAELAKKMRVPLWVDYDDNLLALPADNPVHSVYGETKIQNNIRYMLAIADFVSVSTQPLLEDFYPMNQNITVVRNAWDDYTFPIKELTWQTPAQRVFWRGSPSHVKDLMDVKDDIIGLHKKFPDWDFCFMGYRPWFIEQEFIDKKKCSFIPFVPVAEYFNTLRQIKPAAMIFPLDDNLFNRCKSNIAFLESAYIGAPIFYKDLPEWPKLGGTHWLDGIEKLMSGEDVNAGKPMWEASKSIVKANFLLSDANKTRVKIIKRLAGRNE